MKRFIRKLHRWLGLLMALQIIAWMASGFYFSIFPIEEIRGEHLTRAPVQPEAAQLAAMPPPAALGRAVDEALGPGWELSSVDLVVRGGQAVWRVAGEQAGEPFRRLLRPDGRGLMPMLSAQEARERARDMLAVPASDGRVEWLETVAEDSEIRGRPLPVWKVAFEEPESVHLYIDPWTGDLLARRTDRWRLFDFFWMLHIMDFSAREDFNHPLLQLSAVFGLVIALSGVLFWALTTPLFRRRRPA